MESPREGYLARGEDYRRGEMAAARRSRSLSRGRTGVFLASAVLLFLADWVGPGRDRWLLLGAFGAALLAFLVLVVLHQSSRGREAWYQGLIQLSLEGLARLDRDWDALPPDPGPPPPPGHPYARDLDLFGHGSVVQLTGGTATAMGRERLGKWLLAPAPLEELAPRQEAVRELAGDPEFRDRWMALGRETREPSPSTREKVVRWSEGDPPLGFGWGWLVASWLIPLGLIVGVGVDLVQPGPQRHWLLPLLLGLFVLSRLHRRAEAVIQGAGVGEGALSDLAPLVRQAESLSPSAPLLREIRGAFDVEGRDVSRGLDALRQWVTLAEMRHNNFFAPIAIALLWEVHVAWGLDRWRKRWGGGADTWLDALARLDALMALGTLAHDNPGWGYPRFQPGESLVEAEGLGHPLIPPDRCVPNDVTVGPPGTTLVVTGSNMSGKSTLLRAIGANVVLGQTGAPACVRSLRHPPLRLATCMRVEDSVTEGVSLFMAELNRLAGVVEEARSADRERPLLYLLDEILQGTNTAERQIAARTVLRELLASGAVGAVSTHDLDLAAPADLAEAARAVHFRERVERDAEGRPTLSFDYRLRTGPATSTNALTLLEIVGLGEPSPRQSPGGTGAAPGAPSDAPA